MPHLAEQQKLQLEECGCYRDCSCRWSISKAQQRIQAGRILHDATGLTEALLAHPGMLPRLAYGAQIPPHLLDYLPPGPSPPAGTSPTVPYRERSLERTVIQPTQRCCSMRRFDPEDALPGRHRPATPDSFVSETDDPADCPDADLPAFPPLDAAELEAFFAPAAGGAAAAAAAPGPEP